MTDYDNEPDRDLLNRRDEQREAKSERMAEQRRENPFLCLNKNNGFDLFYKCKSQCDKCAEIESKPSK